MYQQVFSWSYGSIVGTILYIPNNLYGIYPYVARVREVLSPYFAELKRNLAFDFSL